MEQTETERNHPEKYRAKTRKRNFRTRNAQKRKKKIFWEYFRLKFGNGTFHTELFFKRNTRRNEFFSSTYNLKFFFYYIHRYIHWCNRSVPCFSSMTIKWNGTCSVFWSFPCLSRGTEKKFKKKIFFYHCFKDTKICSASMF